MTGARLVGLMVVLLFALPAPAAGDVRSDTLGACLKKLNPDVDIGYERIAARCPELTRRLQENNGSVWLPDDWRQPGNDLSAGGLRELRELLQRPPSGSRTPQVARLSVILAGLSAQNEARGGWWAQTRSWLREVFERNRDETSEDWLSRLVGQGGMSEAVLELVSYGVLALVVVLASAIVLNELRVGGVIARLRQRLFGRRQGGARARMDASRSEMTWDDVQKAALAQRPRLCLELVVARLAEERGLPAARALTVRELTQAASLPDAADRERLLGLARTSERMRFSNLPVADESLVAAVEDGRALLEHLSRSRPDAPP